MSEPKDFMDYVQEHERSWGNEAYTGRPDLADFLQSPVVVFWKPTDSKNTGRLTATLHKDLAELEQHFAKLLFRTQVETPKQRVYKIYSKGREIRVKAVHIEFEAADASP